jgi:predicted RNA-binding Zn-ribbon protein involved in translation (DUF1610 family)
MNIADNDDRIKFAKVCRALMPKEGSVYLTQYWRDKKDYQVRKQSTGAKAGQLRLVRSGASLRYLVCDAPGQEFRQIWFQEDFGTEDLEHFRFGVSDSGEPGNPVDARLVDLRIRMGGILPDKAFDPAPLLPPAPLEEPTAPPDVTKGKSWTTSSLARLWGLGLGMTLALAIGLGVWLSLRHRGRSSEVIASVPKADVEQKPDAPATWAFVICSSCGKKLKVEAGLVGKKLKCPHCGGAVVVPTTRSDESDGPSD